MMGKTTIRGIVEELVNPILLRENFELVDIEYTKEGPHRYLRVFLDKVGGITLDDCQKVSEILSDKLDEIDPIKENYFLEVSSPGLDRPLKNDRDLKRHIGELVEVRLYQAIDKQKDFEGELIEFDKDTIVLKGEGDDKVKLPRKKVAIVRLAIKF